MFIVRLNYSAVLLIAIQPGSESQTLCSLLDFSTKIQLYFYIYKVHFSLFFDMCKEEFDDMCSHIIIFYILGSSCFRLLQFIPLFSNCELSKPSHIKYHYSLRIYFIGH